MKHIVNDVADDMARALFEMLNSVVTNPSCLHLGENTRSKPDLRSRGPAPRIWMSDSEAERTSVVSTLAVGREANGPDPNDSDLWGTESSHELTSSSVSSVQVLTTPPVGCDRDDLTSASPLQACERPGVQTLPDLKQEAQQDKGKRRTEKTAKSITKTSHKATRRSCKIMREEFLKGMSSTRTFVSGPMDLKWNPYRFYCQIFKGYVTIYAEDPRRSYVIMQLSFT